jgi:hypothetical protein
MGKYVLFLVLMVFPATCFGEIYKWIDDKGVINFSDELGKVPKLYRDKAVVEDAMQSPVEVSEKVVGSGAQTNEGAKEVRPKAAEDKTKAKQKPLFGNKAGEAWKQDFDQLKWDIKGLEEQMAGIKERMATPEKMSRGEYVTLQNTVKDLDFRINKARQKLDALSDAANRVELPAEFR